MGTVYSAQIALLLVPLGLSWAQRPSGASAEVLVSTGGLDWQPAPATLGPGALTIRVNPVDVAGGRMRLLVRPPAGMDVNDRVAPRITGLKVDGKPKAPARVVALGRGDWQPRTIAVGVKDGENAVAADLVAFHVDGKRHDLVGARVSASGGTWVLELPSLGIGEHTVTFKAADTSPQQNEVCVTITWERFVPVNYCLAAGGATLRVDSYFPGYPDVAPLQDGKTKLPGDHCLNDVSWASAETPDPHWVEVDFGRVRRISEIILCWAYYQGRHYTSRHLEVQVPDNSGWRSIWTVPPEGLEPSAFTTIHWGFAVTRRFRIYQPPGGGPPGRPNLLWLAEVMAR